MSKEFDAVVIGAGLLGCFTARALCRYHMRVAVLEAREDVCTGISKANTAIIYDGHDTKPGTLKTEMCVRANRGFDRLCQELGVRFSRCGALMVCFGERGAQVLRKKYQQGLENGVEGLRLLTGKEVLAMEPNLSADVYMGLWSPATGTVNPWELCVAAYENARHNGAAFFFNHMVTAMAYQNNSYSITAGNENFHTKAVINCAGLHADEVRELLCSPLVRVFPASADYLVTDECEQPMLHHIVFHEPEHKSKGLTLVPTVDGNILIGPSEQPAENKDDFHTSKVGLDSLQTLCDQVIPSLSPESVIRNFSTLRPNPFFVRKQNDRYERDGRSISSFTILEEKELPGLYSLIGIKTPGLTCSWELGKHVADQLARQIGCSKLNANFDPIRPAPPRLQELSDKERTVLICQEPSYGKIVCRCRGISEGEILDAIHRGAVTVDGVKRRVGSSMGRCQGSFCTEQIIKLLAQELDISPYDVRKDGEGRILGGSHETL